MLAHFTEETVKPRVEGKTTFIKFPGSSPLSSVKYKEISFAWFTFGGVMIGELTELTIPAFPVSKKFARRIMIA